MQVWQLQDPFCNLPEFHVRRKRFILLVQMKELISMGFGSGTSNWKPLKWMRPNQIFNMRGIYINFNLGSLKKFSTRIKSTKFKDILPWYISQMITKTVPISTRTVISCSIKRDILFWILSKANGNWDKNMIWICQWRESHCPSRHKDLAKTL